MQTAGAIGRYFRIDPLLVLDSNYFEWQVRQAAYEYASKAEADAMSAKSRGRHGHNIT